MTKKNIKLLILLPIFLIAELCLWYCILFETSGKTLRVCCFSSIVLACVFALCFIRIKSLTLLLNAGLILTVCADYFLVLPNSLTYTYQMIGTSFFVAVQICYFLFLLLETKSKKQRIIHGIVRACAVLIALTALFIVLKKDTDALSVISLFYIANLITNAGFAFAQGKRGILFGIGLVLFACCDLCVGMQVALGTYLPISETSWLYQLLHGDFNFIWFFYLPSQTILAIALAKYNGYFRKS